MIPYFVWLFASFDLQNDGHLHLMRYSFILHQINYRNIKNKPEQSGNKDARIMYWFFFNSI